ncbi:glutamine synthetase family protein [Ideonella dechloratans]|uniref:glutamine synthetase family protein n=1 Tax=Ideonella dechloratans TaxID=36863 RepID=UPI0035B25DA7
MNRQPPADDLQQRFLQEGVRDVECLFPDVSGYPRGKLMPAAAFARGQELRIAQAIPMQCVTGEYSYDPIFPDADPDVRLVPDMTTLRRSPWASAPRYLAVHDCVELNGELCAFAPRSVLKTVLAGYAALGLSPVVAPEIEFYLTEACTDPTQALRPPRGRAGQVEVGQSAFSMNQLNALAPFWDDFQAALDTLGIAADTWIHEVGCSQYEINLLHGDALQVADQAFLFKYAAKEIALRHGMNAVFMAKPIAGEAGSSMHLHQSVVDAQGRNIFSGEAGQATPAFAHYIGGLQAYLPDLVLLFAPFVNSYRRYVSGSQAPINLQWGEDNRTAGLRVPLSAPAARRVENRLAGADANPYLAIAASLAAGLAGMRTQCNPTAPLVGDGYQQAHELPQTFMAAHARLAGSRHAQKLLGPDFICAYLAVKQQEHDHFQAEITAWERRYLVGQA